MHREMKFPAEHAFLIKKNETIAWKKGLGIEIADDAQNSTDAALFNWRLEG